MIDDLVSDLEALGEDDFYYRPATTKATIDKAAAEITRLRAEVATARAAWEAAAARAAEKDAQRAGLIAAFPPWF